MERGVEVGELLTLIPGKVSLGTLKPLAVHAWTRSGCVLGQNSS